MYLYKYKDRIIKSTPFIMEVTDDMAKKMKKILTAVLSLAMAAYFVPQMNAPAYAEDGGVPAMVLGSESVLKDTANTDNAQTVWYAGKAWRVIKYKDTGNDYITYPEGQKNAMTLFSSDLLATGKQFNADWQADTANDYEGSDLQNTVNGLYDELFSTDEKKAVIERTLTVDEFVNSFPYSTGVSGTEISGYLWPLSTAEALKLPDTFRSANDYWWLRSPGGFDYYTAIVTGGGGVGDIGGSVDNTCGVRPAFDFNLNSVLFTSAAEGGKSSGDEGALNEVGTNGGSEWKLTLESGHDSFKVEDVSTCDGKTVNIKYSGAVAKKGEYISAIIAGEDDAVKYYGNLIEFADGDSTQGTVKVTIDGKMESTDKLYVFNEQLNGDKNTDYSSALHIIDIPSPSGHKYGPWAKLNATQHQKVCEYDETHVVKENHKWDAGKVTKKATEKQAGVKTYTCTVCKATKTETIPKLKPQPTVDKAAAKIALDAGVVTRSSGSKVTASWGAVKGASSYVIYANYCDQKKLKKIKTVSGKTTSFDITKLNGKKFNPKKNLKFYVVAYKTVKGKKVKLAKSIMAHAPGSKNTKRTNVTGVKVKKSKYTLKKGKTAKIKAKLVLQKKSKKPLKHCAKFRYASSNKKVAKVSKKGKITAVGKGKCTVYVYAVSGVSKKIKVTVK